MNKLLIALPLLALVSVGAVFLISHKELEASAVTIQQWEGCRKNAQICDNMTTEQQGANQTNLYACYAAAGKVNAIYNPELSTITDACKAFQKVYKRGIAQDALPDAYFQCVSDMTPSAKGSDFYFNNIFKPLFMTCGGI